MTLFGRSFVRYWSERGLTAYSIWLIWPDPYYDRPTQSHILKVQLELSNEDEERTKKADNR